MNPIVESLKGKLVVSSQALAGNALRSSESMAKMARAAMQGGAAAIRANGVEDITAIRKLVDIPIIGINKTAIDPVYPYITPTFELAKQVAECGSDIIALDATLRPRRDGGTAAELIARIKNELHLPVMADIATYEEGMAAAEAGADIVATTLSGFTPQSKKREGPDLELVRRLAADCGRPVIAEGRYHSPEDLAAGFAAGAHAVVIGKLITNPEFITKYFISQCAKYLAAERTEAVNPSALELDKVSTEEMLSIISQEDHYAAWAVRRAIPQIAQAVEMIADAIRNGGRLIYAGAGTSARLAVQDAAECGPTFNLPFGTISVLVAGGDGAVFKPVEMAEDQFELGAKDAAAKDPGGNDVFCGLSANGNAQYVCGVLDAARKAGAKTIAVINNEYGKMQDYADLTIHLLTGAEALNGSTRMKAGSAQKMTLNMLSTGAMIRTGRVTGCFMTEMRASNAKLRKRSAFIVSQLAHIPEDRAAVLLEKNGWNIPETLKGLK